MSSRESIDEPVRQFHGAGGPAKAPSDRTQAEGAEAFSASDRGQVDAFFGAARAAGGIDNGAPELRPQHHPHYYAAFILDPDQYNIELVCHLEQT